MSGGVGAERALYEGAARRGMRVLDLGEDGLCAVACRAEGCGWATPRDVVAERYAAAPHGCVRCARPS